jgi:hypothetical protein
MDIRIGSIDHYLTKIVVKIGATQNNKQHINLSNQINIDENKIK